MKVISGAMTRPLDYDYLKILSPVPQRFYEIISFQMYATIKNDLARAKLVYSDFCTYAPQTRHFDWEKVRSQMNKVHRPHRASGYITKFDSKQTTDSDGKPDWIMFYTPGPRARAEYRTFTRRGGPGKIEVEQSVWIPPSTARHTQLALELEPSPLAQELVQRGVGKTAAVELVQKTPPELIQVKIEVFDWLAGKDDKWVAKNPAGYLVKSITDDYPTPKGFLSKADRDEREHRRLAKDRQAAEDRRRQQQADTAEKKKRQEVAAYWQSLTAGQQAELDTASIAATSADDLAHEKGPLKKTLQENRRDRYIRHLLDQTTTDA